MSQAQTSEALAWMRMCELVARERAFPVCPLKPAVSVASWEDLDIDDKDIQDIQDISNLIRHVDAPSTSAAAIPAALVVALPIECLARVFSFMGNSEFSRSMASMHSLRLSEISKSKTEPKEKKELRCCKYLLSQGFCLHGRVEGKQQRPKKEKVEKVPGCFSASRQSSLHLACWYCSCTFPHAGVQELSERNPFESFTVVLRDACIPIQHTLYTCIICIIDIHLCNLCLHAKAYVTRCMHKTCRID